VTLKDWSREMKASFKVISLASNTIERVNKFIESGDLFRNSG